MLCYAIAVNSLGGLNGLGMAVFVPGILVGGGASRRRKRPTGAGNVDIDD